jgi:hypothetical protein
MVMALRYPNRIWLLVIAILQQSGPHTCRKTFFTSENSVCPPPGSYTILRSVFPVQNCFTNTLIGLGHDNNPSIDYGMMMVVNNNSSTNNRLVYVDTVNQSMCAGEKYLFSAAFINLDLIDGSLNCPNFPDYPVFELRIKMAPGI